VNKLYFAAATALLLATSSAQASNGFTFKIDGQRVHIERGCSSLSCITVSAPGYKGKSGNVDLSGSKGSKDDSDPAPAKATTAPAPVATPAPAPVQSTAVPPPPAPAAMAPTTVATAPAPVASSVTPAPAPTATAPAPVGAAPVQIANSPIGVWATEANKGNVRIEQCGDNLCGYVAATNERLLINMKLSDAKWVGRIRDPRNGRSYDSTIAMRGPSALRVQGCAMGGRICGGETWKRVS